MNPRGTAYGYLWVDCDKKDMASVEQSLNTLISNTSHIKMDTYHAQLQSAEFASSMMKLGCYLFMAVVGLIGFMNMANTIIMNITTKKQEYGVLQAVGKEQFEEMDEEMTVELELDDGTNAEL